MIRSRKAAAILLVLAPTATPASASSSDWISSEGGRVRLVTAGLPDAQGRFQGALQIELKPGWKTYWRDPGDAGVPPQVDVSGDQDLASAELDFPAPQRHDDGYNIWAGYDYPLSLPIVFQLVSPTGSAAVEASVFLGICETICIPVQARLSVDAAADPQNPGDAEVVRAAFAALPEPARADFGVTVVSSDNDELLVQAAYPGDAEGVDFFIAADGGYAFGQPKKAIDGGKVTFAVPVLARPDGKPDGQGLHYTLTAGSAAVSGLVPSP